MDYERLSKLISHALRHDPESYGLKLLNEGWVDTADLLKAIKRREPVFENITFNDLNQLVHSSPKKRHEIKGERIRALYGHSVNVELGYQANKPPKTLFHGATNDSVCIIKQEGLKPMDRQYVHLSVGKEEAKRVAERKSSNIVVLEIQARKAHLAGVNFYLAENVWLCKAILPEFISDYERQN